MADLIATSAFGDTLPRTFGTTTASEISYPAITSVAPFKGQSQAVSKALKAQTGTTLPGPGESQTSKSARAVWSGLGQCFVLGPALAPIAGAALTDQTDAWAAIALRGADAAAVLARLVPADLRMGVFGEGAAIRTQLGHMNAVILRNSATDFEILIFRSMAEHAAHELEIAMRSVTARHSQT